MIGKYSVFIHFALSRLQANSPIDLISCSLQPSQIPHRLRSNTTNMYSNPDGNKIASAIKS